MVSGQYLTCCFWRSLKMCMILHCFSNSSSVVLFFSFLCSSGLSFQFFHVCWYVATILSDLKLLQVVSGHLSILFRWTYMCGEVLVLMKIFPVTHLEQKFKMKSLLQPWLIFKHLENRISYDAGAGSIFTWDFVQCW
jgi:hypothetical protein